MTYDPAALAAAIIHRALGAQPDAVPDPQPVRKSQRPKLSDLHRERIAEATRRTWAEGGKRRLKPSPNMGRPKIHA